MSERAFFEERYLTGIQPSFHRLFELRYFPAAAVCSNGERLERVIFIEEQEARRRIGSYDWLVTNSAHWKEKVALDHHFVEGVHPSDRRIPWGIVDWILNRRHTASVDLQTRQGEFFILRNWMNCLIGQVDFLELPQEHPPTDIVEAFEHEDHRGAWLEAKPTPFGDIRICVYPSKTEQLSPENHSQEIDGDGTIETRSDAFPIKINKPTIDRREEAMRSSSLIYERISSPRVEWVDGTAIPEVKRLDRQLVKELAKIDKGKDYGYPCKVTLKDGTVLENVILMRFRRRPIRTITSIINHRHEPPVPEFFVNADDIRAIEASPNTMPSFVRERPDSETSMGSQEFKVVMRDGTMHACWYGNGDENPFIDLPAPYRPSDIASYEIDRGYASQGYAYTFRPPFAICMYR